MSKHSVARLLLGATALTLSWAVLVFATGGFVWDTASFRLSSRNAFRPLVVGAAAAIAYCYVAPHAASAFVRRVERTFARRGTLVGVALAAVVAVAGLKWATYTAGSADSYGYISQADLWLTGQLRVDQRALDLPPPFDGWVFSPLGYQPGVEPHTIVPRYSPGLPLLMAAAKAVGGARAAYFVVPLLGGLGVFLTFCLGRLLYDDVVGVCAALLMAASPTFQFQLMWPMSDVPVATAWTLALVFAILQRPLAAGLASGLAIVVRPNLPLLAIGAAIVAVRPDLGSRLTLRAAARRALLFATGALPAVVGVALLNQYLYGGPFVSGYGNLTSIYHWEYLVPNLTRFGRGMLQTQTPFIFAAILPIVSRRFTLPDTLGERAFVRAGLAVFLILVVASYLWYLPFDEWWYLRFLLPGFPVLLVLAVGAFRSLTPLVGSAIPPALLGSIVIVVFGWELTTAQWRDVYRLQKNEQRYISVSRDVMADTPKNAVFFTLQHSGSLRYYAGRLTVRFDSLPAGSLDRAVDILRARGWHPYFLLESWEEPQFRKRFGEQSAAGRLDWPPARKWMTPITVALYDPADRSKAVR